jgi:hypothetical protein
MNAHLIVLRTIVAMLTLTLAGVYGYATVYTAEGFYPSGYIGASIPAFCAVVGYLVGRIR